MTLSVADLGELGTNALLSVHFFIIMQFSAKNHQRLDPLDPVVVFSKGSEELLQESEFTMKSDKIRIT